MTHALRAVAGSLETGSAPPALDSLPAVLDPAHDAVQGMERGAPLVRGLASTVDMLDTIALSITRLADEARAWRTAPAAGPRPWWRRWVPGSAAATA
jgi:hypothetical protein